MYEKNKPDDWARVKQIIEDEVKISMMYDSITDWSILDNPTGSSR